jgi:hypothetical protein
MTGLRALRLAEPAAAQLDQRGRVLGSGPRAIYIDDGSFVVAITARGVPMMPNGVAVNAVRLPPVAHGSSARREDALVVGDVRIEIDGARLWKKVVTRYGAGRTDAAFERGTSVLIDLGVEPSRDPRRLVDSLAGAGLSVAREDAGRDAVVAAVSALFVSGDPSARSRALIGRGGGLTPEGDDFLGGLAAGLIAIGGAAPRFLPLSLRRQTTALSATLLDLAARGFVVEPLVDLVDLDAPAQRWRAALARLAAIGHTTGRAWALGSATALYLCALRRHNGHSLHKERSA